MITLKENIVVLRSVGDCYRYMEDFSTIEQWDPGVGRAKKVTPGAVVPGTEFVLELRMLGRSMPMRYRLVECETNKRLVLVGEGDGFSAHDTIEFEALSATETRIHYTAVLALPSITGAARPVLRCFLERYGRKTMVGLKRALSPERPVCADRPRPSLKQRLVLPAAWEFTQSGYRKMPNKGLSERVDGQVVVISGASSGLGLAAACELSRLGASLHLIGRNDERMQAAVKRICEFSGISGDQLQTYIADLTHVEEAKRVADEIRDRCDHIDVLINNAGALYADRQITQEGYERSLAIHCLAPAQLFHSLLGILNGGQVINVLSGGLYTQALSMHDLNFASENFDGNKAYARAKRALLALTESWAEQQQTHGIRVNAMHPGWADTPGVQEALPGFRRRLARHLRDSRMGADTMVWLATASAASEVNGQFWFDRKAQPTSVFPKTAYSDKERTALHAWVNKQLLS